MVTREVHGMMLQLIDTEEFRAQQLSLFVALCPIPLLCRKSQSANDYVVPLASMRSLLLDGTS